MGLFSDLDTTWSYRNLADDNTNDTTAYAATAEGTISLHIIRPGASQVLIEGEEIVDAEANPNGDVTATIKQNCKIYNGTLTYKVINQPHYLAVMGMTKLLLKRVV